MSEINHRVTLQLSYLSNRSHFGDDMNFCGKWKKSGISSMEKDALRKKLMRVYALLGENRIEEAKIMALEIHANSQESCLYHPLSHISLAAIAIKGRNLQQFTEQSWLAILAPLASFSRRMGGDPNRRFFGLGPIRSDVGNGS